MKNNKRERVWDERYVFGDSERDSVVRDMARALGKSELFAVLLYNRGYRNAEDAELFLRFKETDFHDPYLLADMDKAVDRILSAVEKNEKICIYGDYDVDGVTSVSALYMYLCELGADVCIKIPKREGEGYGVSCAAIDILAQNDVKLVITVDTGITAGAEVEYAKDFGIDFVITDHHECRSELPNACAVVNPHRPDCPYPFKDLAGVGVVFKVICACAMRRSVDQGQAAIDGVRKVSMDYADLTALGTIADVMPVVDENRLIVALGLHLMETNPRPGIKALIEASGAKKSDGTKKNISSGFVGFALAPRINAAGRISDAAIAVRLLLASDETDAVEYAEELCTINKKRQVEENRIAEQAYKMIEDIPDLDKNPVIVLDSNGWQQGIIGIVASKITEKYGLPSILISFDGATGSEENELDDGKGSGRSIKGLNLVEALMHCEDLLVKYGGHELAAGLTVKRGNLDAFCEKINEYAREHLDEDSFKIKLEADCELAMEDITIDFAKELQYLEPYGTGNATPVFTVKNATVKRITQTKGGEHTRLLVEKDGKCITAMYFGMSGSALGFECGDTIDLMFNIDINDYKNVVSTQMIVRDARLAKEYTDRLDADKLRYSQVRGGESYASAECFLPSRDDCARVYTYLRKEYRSGNSLTDTRSVLRSINQQGAEEINYVKLKYIFEILNELNICEIEELDRDIYSFEVIFKANKTSIDNSSILKKLRSQSIDRTQQEAR